MDIKSALRFRWFKFLKPFITIAILSSALYGLSFLLNFEKALTYSFLYLGSAIVLLVIIFIFNLLRHFAVIGSYGKKQVEMDILNPLTKKFIKSRVFVGNKYIVSNNFNLYIHEINDLNWVWADKHKNTIVGVNRAGIQIVVADYVSKEEIDKIISTLWNINPRMLIGNDKDTQLKYETMKKESRRMK